MKFGFILKKTGEFPTAWMCRQLGVSRASYYAWKHQGVSWHAKRDEQLSKRIRDVFFAKRGVYGSPRILDELQSVGERVSRKRIIRLMQELGLYARRNKKFKRTTDSTHKLPLAENLLAQQFNPSTPNEVWAADITYVSTWEGNVYVAVVLDLYSRRVVGLFLAEHLRTELVLEALEQALCLRGPTPGLLHHSDRGSQYASHLYQSVLKREEIVCSMSQRGNCFDNAVVESVFSTLKLELISQESFATKVGAMEAIEEYIFGFYHVGRRHSAAGGMSPIEYELRRSAEGRAWV